MPQAMVPGARWRAEWVRGGTGRSVTEFLRCMPALLALSAGLAMALGQAPWGLWWLALGGVALMLWLIATAPDARAAFLRGWLAGMAGFMLALVWIVEPFLVDARRHGWMAPFALLLLPGGLALFWAAAAAFAVWAARTVRARLALAVPALVAGEALRGYLFTGFSWAQIGHVWIDTPVVHLAALVGAPGLGTLALGLGAALALAALNQGEKRPGRAVGALALAALVLGGSWGWGVTDPLVGAGDASTVPGDTTAPLRLRLVQPNAPQELKWDPRYAEFFFRRHLDLSAAAPVEGPAPDLVIWSETAVPFLLDRPGNGLALAAEATGDARLLLGIQRSEPAPDGGARRFFNALAVIGPDGVPQAIYDKHHLVPFGEYVPILGRFADRLGPEWTGGLASRVLAGYTAGPGPFVLDLGEAGKVLPLICYEAIFARNLRADVRADWLLQVTNDAWFGAHVGPFQHLAQARLRAVEQGLPLVRVANTGVSAVIDPRGHVVASLGMNREGFIDADLPPPRAVTPYARLGDAPWYLVLALLLAGAAMARLRRYRR